ncbi:MAG: site-specific DNA-methyltransferase [Alphaproteobacteria bacterium]|nr:site-specific DNA-methyltransferase [Alphaproteobacteria bacterium]
MMKNDVYFGDCRSLIKNITSETIDLILSDIPYGISFEEWDVIHSNKNSALLGCSPAQEKKGNIFKNRGKPLNGWSENDRKIPLEYYNWVASWVNDWYRVLKPGASVFVFAGRRLSHRCISAFEDAGFIYKDMIAWNKQRAAHRAQRVSCVFERRGDQKAADIWKGWKLGNLRPIFEPILWFMKPYKIGGTLVDNILTYSLGAYNEKILEKYKQLSNNLFAVSSQKGDTGLHPTQKPVALMSLLIELSTTEQQMVLDPFVGSGTTLIAASRLNRNYIGFENNKQYFDIAKKRLENEKIKKTQDLFAVAK